MSKSKIKKSKGIQFKLLEIDKDGEIEFPHRLSKLIDKFSFKPDKEYKKYYFDNFNGKDIYYYSIKNEMCFTLVEDFNDNFHHYFSIYLLNFIIINNNLEK